MPGHALHFLSRPSPQALPAYFLSCKFVQIYSGDLTDPAPDSTPCDDPTTDPQALEGLILEKSKDQEDAMGGAVQAEQEAEQHSVIMRVAIFTWGIHGGPAQEVTFSLL